MNLKYKLKNIFKKKCTSIIDLKYVLPEFKREDFKDTHLIDKYKAQYLDVLKSNKTILLNDLVDRELSDKMAMYIDLFSLNTNADVLITRENFIEEQVKDKITTLKLNAYLNEVEEILLNIKYRLVACAEIQEEAGKNFPFKSKKFILKRMKDLEELTNILESNFLSTENQIRALKLSLEVYKKKYDFSISLIDINELDENRIKEEQEFYIKRRLDAAQTNFKNVSNGVTLEENNSILSICLKEIILGKYAYKNRHLIEENRTILSNIKKEIDEITKEAYSLETKEERLEVLHKFDKKKYIHLINQMSKLFQVFKRYGRIITEEDIRTLYEVKFWLNSFNVYEISHTISYSDLELKIYEDIIFKTIEKIKRDTTSAILQEFGTYTKDVIVEIDKCLRNVPNKEIPYEERDLARSTFFYRNKITFLLYLHYELGVEAFFDEYMINEHIAKIFSSQIFKSPFCFENEQISLSAFLRMVYWQHLISNKIFFNDEYDDYKEIFNIIEQKNNDLGLYSFPDGIKEINFSRFQRPGFFANDMSIKLANKTLVLPSSLKTISSPFGIVQDISLMGVELNDGLEKVMGCPFYNVELEYLSIPASIEHLNSDAFDYKSLKVLEFRDYTESKLNNHCLMTILRSLLLNEKAIMADFKVIYSPPAGLIEATGDNNDSKLPIHSLKYYMYSRPLSKSINLERLVFTDEDLALPIIILKEELGDIEVPYRIEACTDYSINIFPAIDTQKYFEIKKTITNKINEKRKELEKGYSLRK